MPFRLGLSISGKTRGPERPAESIRLLQLVICLTANATCFKVGVIHSHRERASILKGHAGRRLLMIGSCSVRDNSSLDLGEYPYPPLRFRDTNLQTSPRGEGASQDRHRSVTNDVKDVKVSASSRVKERMLISVRA